MERIALIGASGHASDVLGLIEAKRRNGADIEVVGLFHSDPDEVDLSRFEGRDVEVRHLDEVAALDRDTVSYIACVGYPSARAEVATLDVVRGLRAATVVHDRAELGTGVVLGDGVVVLQHVAMSPLVRVHDHAYVSHGALIGHDTVIGAHTSLMPGSSISGDCVLGEGVMVGSNATVLEKVTVGDGAVIGAGSVVTKDVEPGSTVVGIPARSLGR